MKLIYLITLLLLFSLIGFSQNPILLADRDVKPTKNEPEKFIFACQQADKVVITFLSNRDKPIGKIEVSERGEVLFSQEDVQTSAPLEITVPYTDFVHFNFYGTSLGQNIQIKIERIPATNDGVFFNTAVQLFKKYDTSYVEYEIDSVVGYDEIRTPKTFRVIASSDYESVMLHEQKYNIKGSQKNGILLKKPQATIVTDDKELKLVGYQVIITSAAGASEMWDAIAMGVDVGCLCMQLLLPAGGTAASLGVEQAFEMIGPQEGGEPVYYAIMNDKHELDVFLDNNPDTQPLVYETGLATGYNATWFPMDTLAIGLQNLNIAVEVDVSVAVYAVYQSTVWQNISQDIITVKPKTVKVKRVRQVIANNKYWNFQE
ncbi:MAG: hypothetical protein JXR68_08365 [Bacteroidales bacterium]|nr:hypothetical protein [Bacteroidales bacterium]